MTIYLDVLLLSNLWADYALLRTAAAVTHAPLPRGRCLLAAFCGALSALTVFLPPLPLFLCMLGRAALALVICLIAFGYQNLRALLRQTAAFFSVSILFCGMIWLLASLRTPAGWYTRNTVVYADISLLTLLLGTAAAAAAATLRARHATRLSSRSCRIHLRISGQDFMLPALSDTGNTLHDAFSGKPVIVCGTDLLSVWVHGFPDAVSAAASASGFRMIPVRTVTGERLLPAFSPEYAAILRTDSPEERRIDVMLALSDTPDAPAIIPAECILPSIAIRSLYKKDGYAP